MPFEYSLRSCSVSSIACKTPELSLGSRSSNGKPHRRIDVCKNTLMASLKFKPKTANAFSDFAFTSGSRHPPYIPHGSVPLFDKMRSAYYNVFRYASCSTVRWSSGQDIALSRRKQGFDSPTDQFLYPLISLCF